MEALFKEGAGGDHLSVAWQKPGDAPPANGASPIPGAYLASSLHGGELPANSPPVAVAGADQQVVAGTDCTATVAVDGGASSGAEGDALSFTWQLFLDGAVVDTVTGPAAVSWNLTHGTYEAVLTVTTD